MFLVLAVTQGTEHFYDLQALTTRQIFRLTSCFI